MYSSASSPSISTFAMEGKSWSTVMQPKQGNCGTASPSKATVTSYTSATVVSRQSEKDPEKDSTAGGTVQSVNSVLPVSVSDACARE